jgi:tRNA threonylcarbamoyladenosine biosynthesis protein TsaB
MALLLNIDTATESGSIALSRDEKIAMVMINEDQKDHAAWIHNAIDEMMTQSGHSLKELDAVAVTAGPGSYTGLRVGMSTAKGLCYALHIPLITESTLKMMAHAALEATQEKNVLLCPMIDARRMEVFTAVYDANLTEVMKPQPMILNEQSFADIVQQSKVIFFGSGSHKFRNIMQDAHASFEDVRYNASHLAGLAETSFKAGNFTNLAYAEPVYLKEFYTHTRK